MRDLPFFEQTHRELAGKLDAFVAAQIAPLACDDEDRTTACARHYVRRLADGDWLCCFDPIDIRAAVLIRERLAHASALADDMFAMQGLGAIPLALYGTREQQQHWLARINAGAIGAFALTEPDAGSDPAGMKLLASRNGDHYQLTGEKTFISNAGIADVYIVFARLANEPGADARPPRFAVFIVPGDVPGLSSEPIRLISPHPIGTLRLDRVAVPAAQRLGDEGDGLKIALGTLDRFRCTVGAAACGMARRALDESLTHVRGREQFGRPLSKFQAVQFMLAEMATDLDAARLLVARAAWMVDQLSSAGSQPSAEAKRAASMAKLFATDHAQVVIDKAVQLFGGRGLVHGHPVERLYRDIRALRIYEGTSEIQKLVIARTLTGE